MRRFELHGVERGVSVFDDYAHHPTEVAAALAAARTVVGDGRIIAIQQPHTYSRTQADVPRVRRGARAHADHTVVLDVYGAREDPVPGVTGELVSDAFADPSHVHFVADWQEAADYTATVARTATTSSRSAAATSTRSSRRCSRRSRGRRPRSRGSSDRMRRPSPLPPPPADARDRRRGAPVDARRRRRADAADAAAMRRRRRAADVEATPPRPSSRSRRRPRCSGPQRCRSDSARPARSDAADADAPAVGLRDVWRAARARRKALRAEVRRFTVRQRRRRAAVARGRGIRRRSSCSSTLGAAYSPLFARRDDHRRGRVAAGRRGRRGGARRSAAARRCRSSTRAPSRRRSSRSPSSSRTRSRRGRRTSSSCGSSSACPSGVIETRAGFTLVDAAGVALSTSADPAAGRAAAHDHGRHRRPARSRRSGR